MSKTKMQKDLEKGDIIRVEYGDFDHFVTVIVESVSVEGNWCKITCHQHGGKSFDMYGMNPNEIMTILN